jgi:hypothetical protein
MRDTALKEEQGGREREGERGGERARERERERERERGNMCGLGDLLQRWCPFWVRLLLHQRVVWKRDLKNKQLNNQTDRLMNWPQY